LAWITGKAEKNAPVTRTGIGNYCREICKIEVTRGWVDSFISCHSAELIENASSPQEERCAEISVTGLGFLHFTSCVQFDQATLMGLAHVVPFVPDPLSNKAATLSCSASIATRGLGRAQKLCPEHNSHSTCAPNF
jgi:hypothetical protein